MRCRPGLAEKTVADRRRSNLREARIARQLDVIGSISGYLREVEGIRGLFLSGGHGHGLADDFSDIDFIRVARDGPGDGGAGHWRDAVARTGEIVLWRDRTVAPGLINAITADWTRTDVVIVTPEQMGRQSRDRVKPLFDQNGTFDALSETAPVAAAGSGRLGYHFEEFSRVLGLLHLNRLISKDQKADLMSLPVAEPERDSVTSANLACAEACLPRARRMARRCGMAWPDRFEAATWQRLGAPPGVERPCAPD